MFDLSYQMPTKIIYGEHCVVNHAEYFSTLGSRCMIVSGKQSAKACGALDDLLTALSKHNISSVLFDEITQNPLLSDCKRAGDLAKKESVDFIIGVGGGSPMDAAKAIAVFASNEIEPLQVFDGNYPQKPLPIVLIGTTAGTGSEVTPYSVLSVDLDSPDGVARKRSIPNLFAAACFCDYRYTSSLSYSFTISTALDALSHCIEGYFATRANHLSDLFAKTGAKLIVDVLQDLSADETFTPKQRDKLYAGSIYGGLTITQTGTAYCHGLGYFLTEDYDAAHGIACAVFLPSYLELGCEVYYKKGDALLSELDCSISELSNMIENLSDFTAPQLTEEQKEALQARWNNHKSFANSPGTFTVEDALELVENLF